jgi:hypothetical protein
MDLAMAEFFLEPCVKDNRISDTTEFSLESDFFSIKVRVSAHCGFD